MDFQQIAPFYPPFIPPVRLNLHAHSGLLAVMIPGCSPLTNHVLMPTVLMKGGRVGYLEKNQEGVRGSGTISLKVWWCGGEYRYTCWPLTFTSLPRFQTSHLLLLLQWGKILTFNYRKQASSIVQTTTFLCWQLRLKSWGKGVPQGSIIVPLLFSVLRDNNGKFSKVSCLCRCYQCSWPLLELSIIKFNWILLSC